MAVKIVTLILEDWRDILLVPNSEDTSSDSDDEYEPGSNFGDKDAVGEGVIVGKGDADTVGREIQE